LSSIGLSASVQFGPTPTLLNTDIVGSTALLNRYPQHAIEAMDQHDDLLRSAIRRHDGIAFKHTGDGIFAIFDEPAQAIMAAIEAQRDMRAASWGPTGRPSVRFGIHTGIVHARGTDFFGASLAAAARLQSAANGDQILISGATACQLPPADELRFFELIDVGIHHFKGIDPIRVFQIGAADLPTGFPPIGGKREALNGNLTANVTSFLGRGRELESLLAMTATARLITLVGPGGIGKTRLATEFARSLEASFADGVWMVDLAAIDRGSDVWPAITAALAIEPRAGIERRQQVVERLQHARAVLLMDNCEHVLDQIARAVVDLAGAGAALLVINTSRRILGVDGEAVYEVPGLDETIPRQDAAYSVAARLFIERGRLIDRHFQPAHADLPVIEAICRHLDHIPLAIEIAARNLRRLTLAQIAKAVTHPLDLHPARTTQRGGRHQTLRHTLEWSYGLLDETSQSVWRQLSAFSGPFREAQALAVCGADDANRQSLLDAIDDLLESSLLARDAGGTPKLRMLQAVQDFGREKLEQTGRLEEVDRRYGEVFAAHCRTLGARICSDNEARAAHALYEDMSNLRSAFERTVTRDHRLAAELAAPLFIFNYFHRGAETAEWYSRIVALPQADTLPQAPLILAGAAVHALHHLGDSKLAASFIARGQAAEAAGGISAGGWLCGAAGQIELWAGRAAQCIAAHTQAARQAQQAGNLPCEVISLSTAAYFTARLGDLDAADRLVEQVRAMEPLITQPSLLGYICFAQGGVERYRDVGRAIAHYRLSMEWATMGGNPMGALRVGHLIADLQASAAMPTEAVALHMRTLADLPAHGAAFYAWSTVRALLSPLAQLGRHDVIAVLAGALQASPIKLDRPARKAADHAESALGSAAFAACCRRGARFGLTETRAYIANTLQIRTNSSPQPAHLDAD
jgi:predicted ATPase/class 3 adenylate cyclase